MRSRVADAGHIVLVMALLWASPRACIGQDLEDRGVPIAWQYQLRAAAGTIQGMVVHENGSPLEGACVSVTSQPPERWLACTDAAGRFLISGVRPGTWNIEVLTMTLRETVRLVVPTDAGIILHAIMPQRVIGGRCGDLEVRGDGIRAEVRDSVTGQEVLGPVTLRLRQDTLSWERTWNVEENTTGGRQVLALSHRVEVPGLYDIEVYAPGYRLWRLERLDLDVEYSVCSWTAKNRYHSVQLVPLP